MKQSPGFSLIELMIVVVILGLMATLLVPRIMDRPEEARAAKARVDIRTMESALRLYRLDNGVYPTTEQGLAALITKPERGAPLRNYRPGGYLEASSVPRDPWGNEYRYRSPGQQGRDYEITSLGSDGKEGGSGFARDINSWELDE
ncbi:general secretion pathway protein G [Desulfonatronum thiosulfatophilum]|uniref:Type II secretion system core protein G n=1 Tax=Desulfonatronum thiosulfatophilum TaxID=617002 RepID=A0A1G6EE61_9BACT|nr:type II secretion system major pseudopilin GspG [Desulfonatronum thiosulfatophilum]SDB55676.1 general secretion pathway protein G [Desulfonatronum thiosulfatophilum]